jgi:hypothetical protein
MSELFEFIKYIERDISGIRETQDHREVLKTFSGKIIGYIDYKSNGDQELKDYKGLILGRFVADRNVTQNYGGKILSYGNTLAQLLKQ